jgi:diguanylate cyclase (GGDEF)-like protein
MKGKERIKILLIEDNPDDIVLFDRLLRDIRNLENNPCDFIIIPAVSISEAKDYLETTSVDAILISLLENTLYTTDSFLKIRHTFQGHPVLMFSSVTDPALSFAAMKAGINDFICKKDLTAGILYSAVIFSIERCKTAEAMSEEILIDSLTGLYSKKGISRVTSHIQNASIRKEMGLSAVYLDCDKFKSVNDSVGSLAGNELLRNIAMILTKNFRSSDYIARIGEDEFLVFSAGSAHWMKDSFLMRLEKILSNACKIPGTDIVLSVSYGFAHKKADEFTCLEDLIAEAQKAMYEQRHRKKDLIKKESFITGTVQP